MPFELVPKRAHADGEKLRGLVATPLDLLQGMPNHFSLQPVDVLAKEGR